MRKNIFIGFGGILGALARYAVKSLQPGSMEGFPFNTFLVNISGSFLLALLITVAMEAWTLNEDIRLGVTTGFLGAYTTFSTLCKETVMLIEKGSQFLALSYVLLSVVLGLGAAFLGILAAGKAKTLLLEQKEQEAAGIQDAEVKEEME